MSVAVWLDDAVASKVTVKPDFDVVNDAVRPLDTVIAVLRLAVCP